MCSRKTINEIYLYDSAYSGRTSEELDIQLALLYATNEPVLEVNVMPIQQQQRGGADCGVFVAAVCLAIASGDDPVKIRWRQSNMRTHLRKCIESESLAPFPTIRVPKPQGIMTVPKADSISIEIWCLCRLPQFAYGNLVECTKCTKWFHKPCVGFIDNTEPILLFFCPVCN